MSVKSITRRDVVTVESDASAEDIGVLLETEGVGCVVVTSTEAGEEQPVGIVTDRDLGLRVWNFEDPRAATAAELMSEDLFVVDVDSELYPALRDAAKRGIRRFPVVDDGALYGIVTLDDVVVLLAGELAEVSNVIQGHAPPY